MSIQPDPEIWPECSGCDTPYVLRRGLSMSQGWLWAWMPDCRTKTCARKNAARLMNADGPVETVDHG